MSAHGIHNMTHANYESWCPHCVSGGSPGDRHRLQSLRKTEGNKEIDAKSIVLTDLWFARDSVTGESTSILTLVDIITGWTKSAVVPKSSIKRTTEFCSNFLRKLG